MKVLFVARHFTYFRNFDGVIRQLAERGHDVHLVAERDEALGGRELIDRLAAGSSRITAGYLPPRADERWFAIATVLRRSHDYLRYAAPLYDAAPKIRDRAWERTPQLAIALSRWPGRRWIERMLDAIDRAIPTDAAIDRFLEEQQPDLLLLTPLIELGSPQLDVLKSARQRGVRTALAVWSWDHLTSKARIRQCPDRVLVWNATQRDEAMQLHGVADERIDVTGAQCFDHWFDRKPSRSRDAFCHDAGLDPSRPYVLYVCSALFRGSPPEPPFVARWVEAVRAAADPATRTAGILIRPHPQRIYQWDGVPLPTGTAFLGGHPVDERGRDDYFDSMYYAAAVIGLNTSALIEAAIVDRPVLTVVLPEFADNQTGTLHFRYLLDGPHACLYVSRGLAEHVVQLGAALAGRLENRSTRFVQHFIRPDGLAAAATPRFVAALERQAATSRPVPPLLTVGERLGGAVARMWYASASRAIVRRLMLEAGHAVEEQDRARRVAQKQATIRHHEEDRRGRLAAKEERYRTKRRHARVSHWKGVVRRLLTAGGGRGAGNP